MITRKMLQKGSRDRHAEMLVDSITDYNFGLTMQFWRDVDLYGLEEAVLLLHQMLNREEKLSADCSSFLELKELVQKILEEEYEEMR